jgi:hypothetical protein
MTMDFQPWLAEEAHIQAIHRYDIKPKTKTGIYGW